jgi:hypothetical protein
LVVYTESGPDRGRLVHTPFGFAPRPIADVHQYGELPIDERLVLDRTLIVKTHGDVSTSVASDTWGGNYTVSEDDQSEYLSGTFIENLFPSRLLHKLRNSHCLFLGNMAGDWRLRVLVHRIWRGQPLGVVSWAVQMAPDRLQQDFWRQAQVELWPSAPTDYVAEISRHIFAQWGPVG